MATTQLGPGGAKGAARAKDSLTEISIKIPDQPPTGSVVLDRTGRAWQRDGGCWWAQRDGDLCPFEVKTCSSMALQNWSSLLLTFGPVRVIYTAENTAMEGTP